MKSAQQFEDEWYQANWPGDYKSAETAMGPFHDKWQLRDLIKAAQADALEAAALECDIEQAKNASYRLVCRHLAMTIRKLRSAV